MFVVATGYAFTSKRGVIKEGDEIAEKDFATKEAFEKAKAKKKIIDSKELPDKDKDKANAIAAAKKKKEAAEKTLNDAKETLALAEKNNDKAKIADVKKAVELAEGELKTVAAELAALEGK